MMLNYLINQWRQGNLSVLSSEDNGKVSLSLSGQAKNVLLTQWVVENLSEKEKGLLHDMFKAETPEA